MIEVAQFVEDAINDATDKNKAKIDKTKKRANAVAKAKKATTKAGVMKPKVTT